MKLLENGLAVLEEDTHVSRWIEQGGKLCHDETIPLYILPLLNEGAWIVDAGANLGTHCVPYAAKIGESGRVFAFEPNPPVFECLVKNTTEFPNITLYRYALGEKESEAFIRVMDNAGASYLSPQEYPDQSFTVHIRPLDAFGFERVHFIKLDIEGYELYALRGALMTIMKQRPALLIEMNEACLARNRHTYEDIFRFLRGVNYDYRPLTPDRHLPDEQYDLLATPK